MKSKSLALKLNFSTSILLILILIAGIYAIIMINKSQEYAQITGTNWLPSVKAISRMSDNFGNISRRHVLIIGDYATNKSTEQIGEDRNKLNEFIKDFNEKLESYKGLVANNEEKAILEELIQNWKENNESIQSDLKIAETKNSKEAYEQYINKTLLIFLKVNDSLIKLSNLNSLGAINSTKNGEYFTSLTNIVMISIIIFSVILSFIIIQIISKTTKSIKKSVSNLKEQSVTTHEIATNLKNDSQTLSNSVSEQAASVHETTAAINEITSMVNRTAENAKESTEVAKGASEKAEEGQVTMTKLVSAMETIQESNSQLQNIAVIINQINSKTAVINDIVSKTELLSLNASIESARAGEYGQGFAVVAEEVGNLAKISGKSANEIQELITSSQEQVNTILGLTKERVDEGKKVTAEAQESFLKISEDISNMSSVILQISDATREQEIGVRQIATAMTNIDRATQNSQAAVNTSSESAKILVKESDLLDKTTKDVEILITGVAK